MSSGAMITGASLSNTVTSNDADAVFPDASVAVQFTGVVPIEKKEPEAGVQVNVAPGALSETSGSG